MTTLRSLGRMASADVASYHSQLPQSVSSTMIGFRTVFYLCRYAIVHRLYTTLDLMAAKLELKLNAWYEEAKDAAKH